MTVTSTAYPRNFSWRSKSPGLLEFGTLLNVLPAAALVVDRGRGVVTQSNCAMLELTAFSASELINAPITSLFPDALVNNYNEGDEVNLLLNRHNRSPLPVVVQARVLDSSGQWLLLQCFPAADYRVDQKGVQERTLLMVQNLGSLTNLPDFTTALQTVMETARSVLGTDLICIYQAESTQPVMRKIATLEGEPFFPETMPSSDAVRLANPLIWLPGKRVQTELHRRGRIANLTYIGTAPLGEKGALLGLLVVGDTQRQPQTDLETYLTILAGYLSSALQHFALVENLRQRVQEMNNGSARLFAALENIKVGCLILDDSLRVRFINPEAEIMLGYSEREVRQQPVENVLIGPERLPAALEAARNGISTTNLGEARVHHRRGQSFPAHIQTLSVSQKDQPPAVVVLVTDISEHEQTRIQSQVMEHKALLGEFTAVFAHEVRNPINNISMGLQVLATELQDDDSNQDLINRLQNDCTRLNHLMESVLAFSRPMEPKFEPVDLNMLLRRILDRWLARTSRLNISQFYQPNEKAPRILGDPRSLEQVFINLISNAVEAMSKTGGTLAVKISLGDVVGNRQHVVVDISDNGPGIPDDIRERLFEPFVTNSPRGTGLGLAITKRIVMVHKGSISVDSFPGGTVFSVSLPAVTEEA